MKHLKIEEAEDFSWEEFFEEYPETAARLWEHEQKRITDEIQNGKVETEFIKNVSTGGSKPINLSNLLGVEFIKSKHKKMLDDNPYLKYMDVTLNDFYDKRGHFVGYKIKPNIKSWKWSKRNKRQWNKVKRIKKEDVEIWERYKKHLDDRMFVSGWVIPNIHLKGNTLYNVSPYKLQDLLKFLKYKCEPFKEEGFNFVISFFHNLGDIIEIGFSNMKGDQIGYNVVDKKIRLNKKVEKKHRLYKAHECELCHTFHQRSMKDLKKHLFNMCQMKWSRKSCTFYKPPKSKWYTLEATYHTKRDVDRFYKTLSISSLFEVKWKQFKALYNEFS